MVAGILINHMAIIGLQEQWHAYVQMQEYQGIKQTILFELQMPPGFLILMLMSMEKTGQKTCLPEDIQESSSLSRDFSTKPRIPFNNKVDSCQEALIGISVVLLPLISTLQLSQRSIIQKTD